MYIYANIIINHPEKGAGWNTILSIIVKQTIGRVYILGNGFDIDLGYKTKYSDFAKSNEWRILMKEIGKTDGHALLSYLEEKRRTERWFDIEAELMVFASIDHKWRIEKNPVEDEKDFHLLCNAFCEYAKKIEYWKYRENSCAAKLIKTIKRFDVNTHIYSFNYTPLIKIIEAINFDYYSNTNFFDLHGSLNEQDLILGFETNQPEKIRKEYNFLFKSSNSHYKSSEIAKDMQNAHEVVVFGHSLNKIDFVYFKDYFLYLLQSNEEKQEKRELTIITFDEMSERMIKNNIRDMGISLPELYMHAQVKFIKTSNVENGIKTDLEKFESLLNY